MQLFLHINYMPSGRGTSCRGATFTFVFTRYNDNNIMTVFHLHFIVEAVLPVLSSESSAALYVTARYLSLLICIPADPGSNNDEEKYKVYLRSQPFRSHVRISQSVRLCAHLAAIKMLTKCS
jgi:hypothetical protein